MDVFYSNEIQIVIGKWSNFLLCEKKYSENTVTAYLRDLKNFILFLNVHFGEILNLESIDKITLTDIRAWLAKRRIEKISNRSNNRALCSINSFLTLLKNNALIEHNIIQKISRPKISKRLPVTAKYIEIEHLIDSINLCYPPNTPQWILLRDKVIIILLYATGLRISEALGLQVNDIHHTITVEGKGRKERKIPLLSIAESYLKQLVKICPYIIPNENSYIFFSKNGKILSRNSVANTFNKLTKIIGLPGKISPHTLRHSFASHLIENDADVRTVQKLLGHESLSTTQEYVSISDKILQKSYNTCHPLGKMKIKI